MRLVNYAEIPYFVRNWNEKTLNTWRFVCKMHVLLLYLSNNRVIPGKNWKLKLSFSKKKKTTTTTNLSNSYEPWEWFPIQPKTKWKFSHTWSMVAVCYSLTPFDVVDFHNRVSWATEKQSVTKPLLNLTRSS